MKRVAKATMLAIVLSLYHVQTALAVVSPGEYYIVNDLWGKLLTGNSGNVPRLMAYDYFFLIAQCTKSECALCIVQ